MLTNNHVVAPAAAGAGSRLDAVFADGTRTPARIVGRDPKTDLAVIKVEVRNPVVAAIGSSARRPGGARGIANRAPPGRGGSNTSRRGAGRRRRSGASMASRTNQRRSPAT